MDYSFLKLKKIMLVDDETELLKMVVSILKDEGFLNVITASTVQEAINVAKNQKPDLAVLDVMLPDGNGFALFS
ncbi:MAG: response regulator transcription factor, partial [Clostridiales bacterium]|nr:response regulator transcription factor [Clostridiales bacterium]